MQSTSYPNYRSPSPRLLKSTLVYFLSTFHPLRYVHTSPLDYFFGANATIDPDMYEGLAEGDPVVTNIIPSPTKAMHASREKQA
jgi:hypothetical protein